MPDRRHVPRLSVDEGSVHPIIWSMNRFRHRSGVAVNRLIDRMRSFVERHGMTSDVLRDAMLVKNRA